MVRRIRPHMDGGLALPPPELIALVAGVADEAWFLESGRRGAESISAVMARHDRPLESMRSILDWGCGCGRVLRHLRDLTPRVAVFGADYNERLIKWSRSHLTFAELATSGLEPPLPYPAESFDLVYALSVFTHLPEGLCDRWIAELHRVIRPGGAALITTHGDAMRGKLGEEELAIYDGGGVVVREGDRAGENDCSTFHPPRYVRERLAGPFTLVELVPEGALGNPPQDLVVLAKPA